MIHDKNNYCRKADQELVFLTTSDPSNNYHGPQPRDRNPKNQPPSAGNKKLRGNHVQEGQKSTAPPKINTSSRRVITHSIVSFQDSALPSFYPLMKESTGIKGYFDFIIGCTTHGTGWMACQDRKTIMSNRIIGLGDPFDSLAPPPPIQWRLDTVPRHRFALWIIDDKTTWIPFIPRLSTCPWWFFTENLVIIAACRIREGRSAPP